MIKLYDLKKKDIIFEYYSFKEKKGYKFSKVDLYHFIKEVEIKIIEINKNNKFNTVFLPETENKNLIKIAEKVANNVIFIKKNKKEDIIKELDKQKYQKKEKEALFESIKDLDKIKMAKIKGNQRERFVNLLFEEIEVPDELYENSLFLDDSSFSSTTYKAAMSKLKKTNHQIILFFKD